MLNFFLARVQLEVAVLGQPPSTGNMVYEGSDRVFSFPAASGTWYIRLQGIDEFGPSGATYSSEFSEMVTSSDVEAQVDVILADPGRNGDFVVESDRFIVVQPSTFATPTAVFAVGSVDGNTKVGIRGDLLVDGSINTYSLAADSVTANKILVNQLSAIGADMGTVTAGTFRTSPVETGWRTEISDVGTYPIWYGTGTKNSTNAKFYLDNAGNTFFSGELFAATGTFSGSITGGSIDINSGAFSVSSAGAVVAKNIVIEDGSGNTILSSGTGTEWQYVNGKPTSLNDINASEFSDLTTGSGVNLLYNAGWGLGLDGWFANGGDYPTHVNNYSHGINLSDDWTLGGGNLQQGTAFIHQSDQATTGFSHLYNLDYRINVVPGTRYEAHCLMGVHRCHGEMYVSFYDKDVGFISNSVIQSNEIEAPGGKQEINYKKLGLFITAPANAALALLIFRKDQTLIGNTDSYMFVTRPYFGEAGTNQTLYSPWSDGNTGINGFINVSNISTYIEAAVIDSTYIKDAAISSAKIINGAITTAKMVDASVETLKIKGAAVTEQVSALYAPVYVLGTVSVQFNFDSSDISYLLLFISFEDSQDDGGQNATIYVDLYGGASGTTLLDTFQGMSLGTTWSIHNYTWAVNNPPATGIYKLVARKSGVGYAAVRNLQLIGMGSKR